MLAITEICPHKNYLRIEGRTQNLRTLSKLKRKGNVGSKNSGNVATNKKTRDIVAYSLRGLGYDVRTAINTEAASLMIRRTKRVDKLEIVFIYIDYFYACKNY